MTSTPYVKWSERKRVFQWTPERQERLRILAAQIGDQCIARRLGATEGSVRNMRRSLGIPLCNRRYFKWTPEAKAGLERLAAYKLDRDIAPMFGISQAAVRRARSDFGIKSRDGMGRPRTHPRWNPEIIERVREMAGKITNAEIACELGVKQHVIEDVRRLHKIHGRASGYLRPAPVPLSPPAPKSRPVVLSKGPTSALPYEVVRSERITRIVALTERIATLRRFAQSVA